MAHIQTFEIISTRDLAPKTRILYLVLDYEKGPLFAKFVVYRSDQGSITQQASTSIPKKVPFFQYFRKKSWL